MASNGNIPQRNYSLHAGNVISFFPDNFLRRKYPRRQNSEKSEYLSNI